MDYKSMTKAQLIKEIKNLQNNSAITNYTERKQVEDALRESEERFRNLMDYIPGISVQGYDLNGTVLYWNKASEEVYGYTAREALGKNLADLIIPIDVLPLFKAALEAGKNIKKTGELAPSGEVNLLHKDGHLMPIYSIHTAVKYPGKDPILFCIDVDLSDRKKKEKALQESEERYKLLVENAFNGIYLLREKTYEYVNPRFCEITGYSYEELTSPNFDYNVLLTEDAKNHIQRRFVARKRGEEVPNQYEVKIRNKSGKILDVEVSAVTIGDTRNVHVLGIFREITERKQAEEARQKIESRMATLLQNLPNVVIYETGGGREFISDNIYNLVGYTAEELTKDRTVFPKLIHQNDLQTMGKQLSIWHATGEQEPIIFQFRIHHKDGRWIWVEDHMIEVKPENGSQYMTGVITDITERKQAEEAIKQSEEKFRTLFEASPLSTVVSDLEGKIIQYNNAFAKLHGIKDTEKLKNRNVAEFFSKKDLPILMSEIKTTALEGQSHGPTEYTMLTENGNRFPAEARSTLIKDPNGKPSAILGIANDITKRKQAEEALKALSLRNEAILASVPDIIMEVDIDKTYTWANKAGYEFFGEDVLGKEAAYYFEGEQDTYSTVQPIFNGSENTIYVESWQRRKDGERRLLAWWCKVLKNIDGNVTGTLSTARDITERKQAEEALRESEERYRRLFEDDLAGNYISTPEGELITCNPAFASIFGFSSVEEALATPIASYYTNPEDRNVFLELLSNKGKLEFYEKDYLHSDGHALHIIEHTTGVFNEQNELTQIRGYIIDNTEYKTLEEQFNQAQKMEAVGRLAGGIAHDFNNLLTVITGNTELAKMSISKQDPLYEDIEEIRKAAERAAELTHQLLAFSRKQTMQVKTINLNQTVLNIDKMLKRIIGEDIDLKTILTPDLRNVNADPGQIEQIITNLVVNSRDAMPEGGELTIETENIELDEDYAKTHPDTKSGLYVMLAVSDSGEGMSENVRSQIFDPFYTTKETGKGTGLGLSTVYGIVKQSGGNIWVYSEPGIGTSFKIYLPAVEDEVDELLSKMDSAEMPQGCETILIVEDETGVRKLAVKVLVRLGYKVIEAANGNEACYLCENMNKEINLVITDVVMPIMGGVEMVNSLRERWSDLKVLYMSGYTANAIVHQGVLDPGIPYMQKPFMPITIAQKVRAVLDK